MSVRTVVAVLLLAAGVPALVAVRQLNVDNRFERWMGREGDGSRRYEEFRGSFGSDEFVLVSIEGKPLFDLSSLDLMLVVLDDLEQIPGVTAVEGLPKVYRDVFGAEDVDALAMEFTSTPFYEGLFLSGDGNTAGLLVEVEPSRDPGDRSRLVAAVRGATAPLVSAGFTVRLVGSPVLAAALDEVSATEARRVFPVAFVVSVAILMWLLTSIRGTLIAAASAGLSVVLTLGIMVATGRSLSMVSSVLPPLLWVLALANCVHILKSYQHHRLGLGVEAAMAEALATTTRPCALAAITTALGFGSLAAAEMAPVREVGIIAAAGISISLLVNLTVVPTVTRWSRLPGRDRVAPGWITAVGFVRPKLVLGAAAVLCLAGIASLPWILVESNPLGFLPRSNATVRDYQEVSRDFTGSYTMEIVVTTPEPWIEPEMLVVLEEFERHLEASPIVPVVMSPMDILRKARQWQAGFAPQDYLLPASRAESDELIAGLGEDPERVLRRFAAPGGRMIRLSAVVNEMDDHRLLELVDHTEQELADLPGGLSGWVTGMVLRLVAAQQDLVQSQVRSLGAACVVVFLAIALGLGSWRLTLLSVFPNLVPILTVFAIMSVSRIPLDAATVMVASVALGIAVDNTVHLLVAYESQRASGIARPAAAREAVNRVGAAMVVTTATAAAGFFALCLSAFVPIRDFGVLAGSAMVLALVADLYVVPAMLVVRGD